jgi:hypothetical protein
MGISQVTNYLKLFVGLTLVDYICLPERSRIAISYSGEEGAEGFLGLRKI